MASDIETAIKYSKAVESLLTKQFGAQGKGLHEKLSSVERRLPASLVKRIRYLATMRNKVVHEGGFKIPQLKSFAQSCEGILAELQQPVAANRLSAASLVIYTLITSAFVFFIYIAVAS